MGISTRYCGDGTRHKLRSPWCRVETAWAWNWRVKSDGRQRQNSMRIFHPQTIKAVWIGWQIPFYYVWAITVFNWYHNHISNDLFTHVYVYIKYLFMYFWLSLEKLANQGASWESGHDGVVTLLVERVLSSWARAADGSRIVQLTSFPIWRTPWETESVPESLPQMFGFLDFGSATFGDFGMCLTFGFGGILFVGGVHSKSKNIFPKSNNPNIQKYKHPNNPKH